MIDILFFAKKSHQYNYFKRLKENFSFNIEVVKPTHICYKNVVDNKSMLAYKQREITEKYNPIKSKLYFNYIKLITPFFECNYEYFIKKYNPKIVGFWNGVKYPQNLGVEIAKSLNKKCLFFENGFLPNTTQMDFKGVNALNSIPKEKSFYESLNYENISLPKELVPRKFEGKQKLTDVKLPKNYIFVPFQVGYDSQIIYFSNFKSMRELFYLIKDISQKLGLTFVFKEHPSDKVNDYSDLYKESNDKLIFANSIDTKTLIQNSNAVITINSSVGTEAMLFNKKVFVLGEAFYAIDGITFKVTKKSIYEELKAGFEVDEKLIKNFLAYLLNDYLIPESWKNPNENHFKKIEQKIKEVL
jgi:capsular polysaccharide export protein